MGGMLMGALLGGNQSFEDWDTLPVGWSRQSDQASFYPVTSGTQVHSSATAMLLHADSTGGTPWIVRHDHGAFPGAGRDWFPAVDTHTLTSWVWARAVDAPSSGQVRWALDTGGTVYSPGFAFGGGLLRYEAAGVVTAADSGPLTGAVRAMAANSQAGCLVDDVLTCIDVLDIHPDWALADRETHQAVRLRTRSGHLGWHSWGTFFGFRLPLGYLSTIGAGQLNWWWETQAPLALTLDTSDTASTLICRMVNETQPVGTRMRPYADQWSGVLQLESINRGGLAF